MWGATAVVVVGSRNIAIANSNTHWQSQLVMDLNHVLGVQVNHFLFRILTF